MSGLWCGVVIALALLVGVLLSWLHRHEPPEEAREVRAQRRLSAQVQAAYHRAEAEAERRRGRRVMARWHERMAELAEEEASNV